VGWEGVEESVLADTVNYQSILTDLSVKAGMYRWVLRSCSEVHCSIALAYVELTGSNALLCD